ncbi:TetR/AcrR family transcriptional regulator [Liquorilactobacillus oeni]|uniref:Transcriptional regulator n=1 Tax=Liquorilactobacillus oeni DSM 19972 TaxID=1423777 RepID=A0A0R1MCF6_9LACO|nr:TetR/AcrR family transcriptional regulator [Liquorilactobacillus oeni]KRL05740.1 transcriptional regulator [Liquorilactobacillus oeni DSM 19972]
MPKETFFRLDPAKKRQLFVAIKDEFSRRSFAASSISEIVKNAKIARGSFYQYFEDKLDCYLYFAEILQKKRRQLFADLLMQEQGDLFAAARLFFEKSIYDVTSGPYAQYYRVMTEAHDYRLYWQQHLVHNDKYGGATLKMFELTKTEKLRISDYEEYSYLLELIYSIFFRTIRQHFQKQYAGQKDTPIQMKEYCFLLLDWLENGVKCLNNTKQ